MEMLLERDRRFSTMALSLLMLALILIGAACTVDELPPAAEPTNVPTTDNKTAPVILDIKFFAAQPKTIKLGENAALSWQVAGASSLSIDPDIGSVKESSGSTSISPKATTLYTLRASDGLKDIPAIPGNSQDGRWSDCLAPKRFRKHYARADI